MSSLEGIKKLLKEIRVAHRTGRRLQRSGDPSKGLEGNTISTAYRVSRQIYSVDIAKTPQVVKDNLTFVDVNAQARRANSMRNMVDYVSYRVKGRGR